MGNRFEKVPCYSSFAAPSGYPKKPRSECVTCKSQLSLGLEERPWPHEEPGEMGTGQGGDPETDTNCEEVIRRI